MSNEDKSILQSVDNALQILDLFEINNELGVTEISRLISCGKSTAFRLTTTLENRGFIIKKTNGKFVLGARLLTLGTIAKERVEIIHVFKQELIQLAEDTKEIAYLYIWADQYHVISIDKVSKQIISGYDSTLLKPQYPHQTSAGKVLLAAKSDDYIQNYVDDVPLNGQTPFSNIEAQELWHNLEEIRVVEYAIDEQQHKIGYTSIAVVVKNTNGLVIGAISISGPHDRIKMKSEYIITKLKASAERIQKRPI